VEQRIGWVVSVSRVAAMCKEREGQKEEGGGFGDGGEVLSAES